ncbi:hypothetical protein [Streptomyces sp. NPDC005953]|uniref:hypothetical protein n=1 Tax=Streptomyces sp. NPDC005953 TaxID=3156719 RepID=UPI0033CCC742
MPLAGTVQGLASLCASRVDLTFRFSAVAADDRGSPALAGEQSGGEPFEECVMEVVDDHEPLGGVECRAGGVEPGGDG